ncbi:MAG: ABC transporter permease [Christensenellales bacterium]|jgi:putative aldouronate transport system permease protein
MNRTISTKNVMFRKKQGLVLRISRELRKNLGLYILVLAPVAYLIIFKYIPIYGVQIAFRDFTPVRTVANSPWVSLKYVRKFLTNYQFERIMWNTIKISFLSLATFPLPIIFALMLNYLPFRRLKKTIQLVSYAPHFISTVVMVGIILQFLDVRGGLINYFIVLCGGEPINFMAIPEYFVSIYIWSGVWQSIGYNSIIYIAALSGVSPELHEAAIVDGANIMKRIWHVDVPTILPTMTILLIMRCGSILSVNFEKVFLMQNNLNIRVSEIISTYVYKQGLATSIPQYSYAAAIGLFVSVINVALLVTVNAIAKRTSEASLW